MKNKLLTLASVLVLLAVLGKFYAVPAIAQAVRAALIQNTDEPGRIPYEAESACSGVGYCFADFPAVPANKRLVITRVVGSAQAMTAGGVVSSVGLAAISSSRVTPPIPINFVNAGNQTVTFNDSVITYADAGYVPRVSADATASQLQTGVVGIFGYLLDCTTGCAPIAP